MIKILAIFVFTSAGSTSAASMELSRGGRAFALGGELTAFASLDGIYYNPSHLILLEGFNMNITTFPIALDIIDNTLLLGYSKKNLGGAIRISYVDYGNFVGLDEHAREKRLFTANDVMIGVLGAYRVSEILNLGMEFKYFKEVIDAFNATSYSLSLGMSGRIDNSTEYGISLRNIGTGLKFISESSPIPLCLALGGTKKINDNMSLLGHVRISRDIPFVLFLGSEYVYDNTVAFRMGFRSDRAGFLPKFSLGIGFAYKKVSFDFGLSGYQNLGPKYVVSLSLKG